MNVLDASAVVVVQRQRAVQQDLADRLEVAKLGIARWTARRVRGAPEQTIHVLSHPPL
jgi:hypothetical protein